jgi:hypothetical protein
VPEHAGHPIATDGVPYLWEPAHALDPWRARTASRRRRMVVEGNTRP